MGADSHWRTSKASFLSFRCAVAGDFGSFVLARLRSAPVRDFFFRWAGSPGMRTGSRMHPPCSWKKRARIGEIKSLTSRRFFGFGEISCVFKTFRQNNSIHIPLLFHWSGRYIKPHLPRNGFNNDCYVQGFLISWLCCTDRKQCRILCRSGSLIINR